jgi:hypothetical protein
MPVLYFILALLATICFVVGAFWRISDSRSIGINWVSLGLAFMGVVWTIQYAQLAF